MLFAITSGAVYNSQWALGFRFKD